MQFKIFRKLLVLFVIVIPFLVLIMFLWGIFGKYMNTDFRRFVKTCKGVPTGLSKDKLSDLFSNYENMSAKKDLASNGLDHRFAFRLNEEYSGDICFVNFSNDGLVISSEFSPD